MDVFRAIAFNQDISAWNVSNVNDISGMFYNAQAFNQPLNSWNVSSVTNMTGMFYNAQVFNQDISSWNTSNVTSFYYMFQNASSFNQPLNTWDVSEATNTSWMFSGASAFDQDISAWNVSNVIDMSNMFAYSNFNQPLDKWDVSSATNMGGMFSNAVAFNQDISAWNVSNVTNMSNMFSVAIDFNQSLNNWDVSNVTNMAAMFSGATNFNQPLNSWVVNKVTAMSFMFNNAPLFDQELNSWDVSNVTNMMAMFQDASSFNKIIDQWNINKVTNMSYMFFNAATFNQDISNWNITSVSDMTNILYGTSFPIENYDALLTSWSSQDVQQNVIFGTFGLSYCAGEEGRNILEGKGWTFNGDSKDCLIPEISFEDITKTYGDNSFDLLPTSDWFGNFYFEILSDTNGAINLSETSSQTVTILKPGSVSIRVNQEAEGRYDTAFKDITLVISKKDLNIIGLEALDKVYDETNIANVIGTAVLDGIVNNDDVQLDGVPVYSFETLEIGNNIKILTQGYSLIGPDSDNYNLLQPILYADITEGELSVKDFKNQITLYPNPTNGKTFLNQDLLKVQQLRYIIYQGK